jgi:hypothetical protein
MARQDGTTSGDDARESPGNRGMKTKGFFEAGLRREHWSAVLVSRTLAGPVGNGTDLEKGELGAVRVRERERERAVRDGALDLLHDLCVDVRVSDNVPEQSSQCDCRRVTACEGEGNDEVRGCQGRLDASPLRTCPENDRSRNLDLLDAVVCSVGIYGYKQLAM